MADTSPDRRRLAAVRKTWRPIGRLSSAVVDRLVQWWWLDVPLVALAALALAWKVKPSAALNLLGDLPRQERLSVFTDLLQLATLFAGFGGVAFAVYLGMTGRNVERLRDKVGRPLLRVWLSALLTPWLCALALIVAKVVDTGGAGGRASWVIAYGALVVLAAQLARTAWVFAQLALLDMQKPQPAMATSERAIAVVKKRA